VQIKKLAKKGELASVKTLAKELVRTRKAKNRIFESKARIHSVSMQLKQQQGLYRIHFRIPPHLHMVAMQVTMGAMQKSAGVMQEMNAYFFCFIHWVC
jgi:charged multivesicular body protein 3